MSQILQYEVDEINVFDITVFFIKRLPPCSALMNPGLIHFASLIHFPILLLSV